MKQTVRDFGGLYICCSSVEDLDFILHTQITKVGAKLKSLLPNISYTIIVNNKAYFFFEVLKGYQILLKIVFTKLFLLCRLPICVG